MKAERTTIAVDYYPEHWSPKRWGTDIRLMHEAGVTAVRIAEFAWSRIEPKRETFRFEWLDEFIANAWARDIRTILCTPTATPPAWLCEEHPEILARLPDGRTMSFGARRHYDPASKLYRAECRRITRTMGEHFATNPAVFAWQIDNELLGNTPSFSDSMREAFQKWLAEQYQTPERLNEAWGTSFWSQEYTGYSQVPLPAGNPGLAEGERAHHPSLQLAFRRFQSDIWVDFCQEQAAELRLINPDWLLTTNAYLFRWGDAIDHADMFGKLDRFSFDNYSNSLEEGAFYNDLAASLTPRYWILEQKCGPPEGQYLWPPAEPDMSSLAIQTLEYGAELVSFFRFRQARFGQEQNHGAILAHDGEPREYYETLRSIAHADPPVRRTEPVAYIHYSWEDSWIRQIEGSNDYVGYLQQVVHPGLARTGYEDSVSDTKERIGFLFARRIAECSVGDLSHARLFVIPMAYRFYSELAELAEQLVNGGATVICTPDLGRKNEHNVFYEENLAEVWQRLLGIQVERHYAMNSPATTVVTEQGYVARHRLDHVQAIEASVLDVFLDGPQPGAPALTRREVGSGAFVYASALYDQQFWVDVASRSIGTTTSA
ncbi:MAG: beta-galactosidase [Spirochaetota bacterium]